MVLLFSWHPLFSEVTPDFLPIRILKRYGLITLGVDMSHGVCFPAFIVLVISLLRLQIGFITFIFIYFCVDICM